MLLPEPRTRCLAPAGVHRVPGLPRFCGTCSQWLDFMLFGIPISRFQICPVHILNIPSSPHPSILLLADRVILGLHAFNPRTLIDLDRQ